MIPRLLSAVALFAPVSAQAAVVINELSPNPTGTDTGFEWLELHNTGSSSVDISGWKIEDGTSKFSAAYTFPASSSIPAGGYVTVGDVNVAGATFVSNPTLAMGNASSADAVRLVNNTGVVQDTVVYGTPNSDSWIDDSKATATSLAPFPVEGHVLARQPNGVDTNLSGADFKDLATATFGAANPAPVVCSTAGTVKINEFMANPTGTDAGSEWIELYNAGGTTADVSGWQLQMGTSAYDSHILSLPANTSIPSQGYLLVGETNVVGKDVDAGNGSGATSLELGNAGSNADGLRLVDCTGAVRDSVVYGTPNSDNLIDDSKAAATSMAPGSPPDGQSLARTSDGVDTNLSAADFALDNTPTPKAANDPGPIDTGTGKCENVGFAIKINELMPDPQGTDSGVEWIELYNATGASADLSGWKVAAGTSTFSPDVTLPPGTTLAAGGFLVVGGTALTFADVTGALSLGNASSNADGVRLEDCSGAVIDTVVYGQPNSDGLVDDTKAPAVSMAPKAGSGQALARHNDGLDTNQCGVDFEIAPYPTPGLGNDTPAQDCGAGASRLKVNEFLVNPPGTDSQVGLDWIEIYNAGTAPETVTGWKIQVRTGASWGDEATLPTATIAPGDWYLVGGANVAGVDVPVGGFDLGSGSDGDGVRLSDCKGYPVDTVAYGGVNLDGINDDSHDPALSVAPAAGENQSLQRVQDGYDTGDCRQDFAVQLSPTPGAANPDFEPVVCTPSEGTVVINEFIPDPDGADADREWIELYNSSGDPVSVSGWYITTATRNTDYGSPDVLFPGGATVGASGFLVIGGTLVPEADIPADFSIGGGDRGDALVLYDCEGAKVDTVVYGPSNEDGMSDDLGNAPGETYGDPPSKYGMARVEDGVDDNVGADWFLDGSPTPGATNFQPTYEDTDTGGGPSGGCCRSSGGPADSGGPGSSGGRCNTTPNGASLTLLLGALLWIRRRR